MDSRLPPRAPTVGHASASLQPAAIKPQLDSRVQRRPMDIAAQSTSVDGTKRHSTNEPKIVNAVRKPQFGAEQWRPQRPVEARAATPAQVDTPSMAAQRQDYDQQIAALLHSPEAGPGSPLAQPSFDVSSPAASHGDTGRLSPSFHPGGMHPGGLPAREYERRQSQNRLADKAAAARSNGGSRRGSNTLSDSGSVSDIPIHSFEGVAQLENAEANGMAVQPAQAYVQASRQGRVHTQQEMVDAAYPADASFADIAALEHAFSSAAAAQAQSGPASRATRRTDTTSSQQQETTGQAVLLQGEAGARLLRDRGVVSAPLQIQSAVGTSRTGSKVRAPGGVETTSAPAGGMQQAQMAGVVEVIPPALNGIFHQQAAVATWAQPGSQGRSDNADVMTEVNEGPGRWPHNIPVPTSPDIPERQPLFAFQPQDIINDLHESQYDPSKSTTKFQGMTPAAVDTRQPVSRIPDMRLLEEARAKAEEHDANSFTSQPLGYEQLLPGQSADVTVALPSGTSTTATAPSRTVVAAEQAIKSGMPVPATPYIDPETAGLSPLKTPPPAAAAQVTGHDHLQAAGAIGGTGTGLGQAQSVSALTSGPETSINRSLQFTSQVGGVPGPNADRSAASAPSASTPGAPSQWNGGEGVGSAGSGHGAVQSEATPLGSPITGQSVELTPIAVQVAGLSTPATSHAGTLAELSGTKGSAGPRMNVTQYPTTGTAGDTSMLLPADIGEERLLAAQATSAGASRGLAATRAGVRRFAAIAEEGDEQGASQLDATGPVYSTGSGLMGAAQDAQLMTPPGKSRGYEHEHAVSSPDTVMKIEQAMAQARAARGAPTGGTAAVQQQQPAVADKIHLQMRMPYASLLQLVLQTPVAGQFFTAPAGGPDLSFNLAPAWTRTAEVQLPIRNAGQRPIQVQASFSAPILSITTELSAGNQDVPCTVKEQELLNCSCLRATVHHPILQATMSSNPSVHFDAAQLLSIPSVHAALCSHAGGQASQTTQGSLVQYGLAVSATLQLQCAHSDASTPAIYRVPVLAKFAVQLQLHGQRQGLAAVPAPTVQPAYPGTGAMVPQIPAHHQVAYPMDPQTVHVSSSLPDLAGPSARIQSYAGPAQGSKPEYAQRPLSPRRVVPQQQSQHAPTASVQPGMPSFAAPGQTQGQTWPSSSPATLNEEAAQAVKFARALRAQSAPRAASVPAAESVQPTQQQQSTSVPVPAAVKTVSLPVSTLATDRGIFELGRTVPPAKQRTLAQPVQTEQPARAQGRASAPISAPRQQQAANDGPAVYSGRGGRLPVTPQQKLNAVTAYRADGNDSVAAGGSKELSPERTLPVKRGGVMAASPPKGRETVQTDCGRAAATGAGRGGGGGVARHLSMEDRLSQASDVDDRPVVHLGTRIAAPPKPQIRAKELSAQAAQMRAGATDSLSTLVVSQQQERTARVSTRPSSAPEKSQAKATASTGTSPKALRRSLVDVSVQASPSPPSSPEKAASQAAAAGGVRNAARQLISPLPEKVRARMTIDSAPAPMWQPSNALLSDAATVAGTITDERIDAASSITRHLEGRHTARGAASGQSKRAAELSIAEHRRLAAAAASSSTHANRRLLTKPAVPHAAQSQMAQRAAGGGGGGTGGRAPQLPSYMSAPAVPPQVPHRLKSSTAGTRAVRMPSTGGVGTVSSAKPAPHSALPTARAGQVAVAQQDMVLARHDTYPSGYTAFPGDFLPPEESEHRHAYYAPARAWTAPSQGQAFGRMRTGPHYMQESGQAAAMRQVQGMPAEGAARLRSPVPSSAVLATPPPGRGSGKAAQGVLNDTVALDRMEGGLRGSVASRMLPTPPSAIKEEGEYMEMDLQYQRLHPSTAASSTATAHDGAALSSRQVIRHLVAARPRELASPPETPERAGGRAAGSSVPAWEQTPVPAHTAIRTDMQALEAVIQRAKAESAAVLQFVEDSINASVVAVEVGEEELYEQQPTAPVLQQEQEDGQGAQQVHEDDIDEDQFTDARDTSMMSVGNGQADDAGIGQQQQQQQDFAESAGQRAGGQPFDTPAVPMRPRRYHQERGTAALAGYTPGPAARSYVALHMGTPSPVPLAEHLSAIPPPPPVPSSGVPGQSPARAARAYAQAKGRAPTSMPDIASPPSLVPSKVAAIDAAASQSRALLPRRPSSSSSVARGGNQGTGMEELTAGLEWANARAQTIHAERNLLDLQSRIGELGHTTAGMPQSSQMGDPLAIAADVRESVARMHAVQAQHEREDEMQGELDRSTSSTTARTVFPAFTKTADSLQLSAGGSVPARSVLTSPNTVRTGVLGTGSWGTAKSTPAGLGASTQSTASAASQLMFGTLVDGSAGGPPAPSLPVRQQPPLPAKQAAPPRHSVDMTESPIVSAQDEEGLQGPSLTALDLYHKPAGGAAGSATSRVPLEPRAAVPGGATAGRTAVGAPQASAQGVLAAAEGGSLAQKRAGGARRVPHGGVASAVKGAKPSALIEEQGQSDVYAVVASAAPAPAPAAVQARWYVHPSCSALTIPTVLPEPSAGPLSTAVRICNTSSLPVVITVYGPDGAPLPVLAVHEQGQAPHVVSGGPALMGLVAHTGYDENEERRRMAGEVLVPARGESKVILALALPPVPGYDVELDERGDTSIPEPVPVAGSGWSYMHASHTLKAVLSLHGRHVHVGNGGGEDEQEEEEEEEQAGSLTGLGFLSPTRGQPARASSSAATEEPPSIVHVRMTVLERAWTLKGWSMDVLAGRLKADDRKVKMLTQMQAELPLARALANTSLTSPDFKVRSGRALPQSTQGTPQHPAPALMQHLAVDGVAQGTTGSDGAGHKARVPPTPASGQAGLASPASAVRGPSARVPHPASPLTMPTALVPQVKPKASSAASVGLEFAQAPSLTGSSSSSPLGIAMKTIPFTSTHAGQTSIVKVQICNTSQYPLAVQVGLLKCTMSSFKVRPSHTMFTLEPRKFCMLPVTFSPPLLPTTGVDSLSALLDAGISVSPAGNISYNCLLRLTGSVASSAVDSEDDVDGVTGCTGMVRGKDGKAIRLLLQAMLVGESPHNMQQ